ncbi:MAG: glycosyltransferase family 2 protein [Lachnospiraceae bacterium]|nr:glycosyltransferase family 2 protein [Lachnospiraceae bacterium]
MVSVIIPVYNGANYIRQTVTNILNSTYQDLEVILVVDGSPDNSLEICQELSKEDSRVHAYYKENGGIPHARNYGIERATGDYICVCDQDDVVQNEMYERMVDRIDGEGADICMCSTGQLINGEIVPFETFPDSTYVGDEVRRKLLYPVVFEGYDIPGYESVENRHPSIWKTLIRRDFYLEHKLNFHAYVSFEDDLLMLVNLLAVADKVCTVSYRGYLWNINLNSESHARKYIADMGLKQRGWVDDICASVALSEADDEVQKYVRQVTNCKVFVDAILNLCSPYRQEKFGDIRDYYEKNIYCYDFKEAMEVAPYAQRKFPMQRYILKSLSQGHTYRSYFVARTLVFILDNVLKSKLMMKLDSLMKGN